MRRTPFSAVAILLVVVLWTHASGFAQDGDDFPTDNDVNAVAEKLYCPVCPNTPLDVCETQACQDWRAQIREQLEAGWTEDQIVDYFVTEYGERVLAEPQRRGFTSLVWVLPVMAVAVGGVALRHVLAVWRRRAAQEAPPMVDENPPDAEILERIERELKEMQ
jgi:cytochrome c-type biogenesis protein CcmH